MGEGSGDGWKGLSRGISGERTVLHLDLWWWLHESNHVIKLLRIHRYTAIAHTPPQMSAWGNIKLAKPEEAPRFCPCLFGCGCDIVLIL